MKLVKFEGEYRQIYLNVDLIASVEISNMSTAFTLVYMVGGMMHKVKGSLEDIVKQIQSV